LPLAVIPAAGGSPSLIALAAQRDKRRRQTAT
jgi:hypothetical protein